LTFPRRRCNHVRNIPMVHGRCRRCRRTNARRRDCVRPHTRDFYREDHFGRNSVALSPCYWLFTATESRYANATHNAGYWKGNAVQSNADSGCGRIFPLANARTLRPCVLLFARCLKRGVACSCSIRSFSCVGRGMRGVHGVATRRVACSLTSLHKEASSPETSPTALQRRCGHLACTGSSDS